MIGETTVDQSALVAALASGDVVGMPAGPVEHIETHANHVFLAGDLAFKIKKAVRFPFLDYGTLDRRRTMCARELSLNRRTAPALYRRVVTIVGDAAQGFRLADDDSHGEPAVEMLRFDQSMLLDRVAAAGPLDPALVRTLADRVRTFHEHAEAADPVRRHGGGAAGLAEVVEENLRELEAQPSLFDPDQVARLARASRAHLESCTGLLDARLEAGQVRHCHGDLHLKNICLLDGVPTLFDAIEFDDAISVIDVLYDLAFLLMDLAHRGLEAEASETLSRYLQPAPAETADGLAALPLFAATRAAIRAKIAAASPGDEQAKRRAIAPYMDLAESLLADRPAIAVAIGGLPGTGKSTRARALAPLWAPAGGAVHLNSDVIRKRRRGLCPEQSLPQDAYTSAETRAVYEEMAATATRMLAAGRAVVLDATFHDPWTRNLAEEAASAAGVAFHGIWLEAPHDTLARRLAARQGTGDASDAGPQTLALMPPDVAVPAGWHSVDATDACADGRIAAVTGFGDGRSLARS